MSDAQEPDMSKEKAEDSAASAARIDLSKVENSGEETKENGDDNATAQLTESLQNPEDQPAAETAPAASGTTGRAEETAQPGMGDALFRGFASAGPLLLFIVLAVLVWGAFWKAGHGVYCPPESAFVTALLHCMEQNSWLAPVALLDGSWSGAQWPVFYWIAWLLALVPDLESSGLLLPTLSTLAAAIILLSIWSLSIAAGFGKQSALASGLIIIAAPFFVPVAHFVGPMPTAAALMLLSLAFFARGWRRLHAWLSLPLAFIFAALAGLCGGPVYLAIPLVASFCFLIWQGRFRRAQSWDAIFGFALMLVVAGGWLLWVSLAGSDNAYLNNLFTKNLLFGWPPVPLWWRALLIGVGGILPWTLLVFTVSWPKVFARLPASLAASRKDNASMLVWTSLILVCIASPFMPLPPDAGLPLIFLVAVLLGKAFINLSPLGNRSFFLLAGIFVCVLGLVIIALGILAAREWLMALLPVRLPQFLPHILDALPHLYILGILILVCGLGVFFFARRCRQSGALIYGAIVAIAVTQFAVFMLAPDLATLKSGPLLNLDEIKARVASASAAPVQQSDVIQPEMPQASPGEQPVTEEKTPAKEPPIAQDAPEQAPSSTSTPEQKVEKAAPAEQPENTIEQVPQEIPAPEKPEPLPPAESPQTQP